MIGIIFNHDMGDDPYNQNAFDSGVKKLNEVVEKLDEDLFVSLGQRRDSLVNDMEDEYVIVQHTCNLSQEEKNEIVDSLKEMLTLKKSVYKDEMPGGIIVFEKIEEENIFAW